MQKFKIIGKPLLGERYIEGKKKKKEKRKKKNNAKFSGHYVRPRTHAQRSGTRNTFVPTKNLDCSCTDIRHTEFHDIAPSTVVSWPHHPPFRLGWLYWQTGCSCAAIRGQQGEKLRPPEDRDCTRRVV